MNVTFLEVRNVRNIREATLVPSRGINFICGTNGAGKTSLLEAMSVLGSGRSFVTHRGEKLIRQGANALTVHGQVQDEASGIKWRLGLRRSESGGRELSVNGKGVDRIDCLAVAMPLQLVHPDSHVLISGGPGERRTFMDWGLFHVEPSFINLWRRYRIALKQRNGALRAAGPKETVTIWDRELAVAGSAIDALRRLYLEALTPYLATQAREFFPHEEVKFAYRRGWSDVDGLLEALSAKFSGDSVRQTTSVGPHRADLRIEFDGSEARQRISRGQQKLLVYALRLAQTQHFAATTGRSCILLLDDLGAELDAPYQRKVLEAVKNTNCQVFIASVDSKVTGTHPSTEIKVFHVERGQVTELL
jgi:DNA replication and repair protein RecF